MITRTKRRGENSRMCKIHLNSTKPRRSALVKGLVQVDYIIAIGVFLAVFALVVQYVSNYYSGVGDKANINVMTGQATSLLDIVERGYEPANWPQLAANSSIVLLLYLDNSTLDSSQYGNNGTIQSGADCSAAVVGQFDKGCSFDGINDLISINDQANINFTTSQSFTAEAWVNPFATNAAGNWTVVSKQNGAESAGWRIFLNATTREFRATLSDGTNTITLTSYSNVTNNTWSHVALVVNRAANTSTLFYNGTIVNNSVNISTVGDIRNNEPVRIGGIGGGHYFNGSIDEVIISNRTLAEDEIYIHWAYENLLDRIGLSTRSYRFYIYVNNTQQYWYNSSVSPRNIANELIKVNYTDLGLGVNPSTTAFYDDNGNPTPYEISGTIVTAKTTITPNSDKTFTIYVDDDSNFREQTTTISGTDNLSEVITQPQAIPIVQYKKILFLNNSNYTRIKNATQLSRDFAVRLVNANTSVVELNFGPSPPPSGSIVALRRFTLYQNSTGGIKKGRLTVQVW